MPPNSEINTTLAALYQSHSRKVLATLVRLLGDFDLAEEAMHEAFNSAMESWGCKTAGVPENPCAWLISTGRFKAIDLLRRQSRLGALQIELQQLASEIEQHNSVLAEQDIEDDQLRLIFACCHPALDPKVQVPLTLREVCGLRTEEIASAFLVSSATMAQRIVRGKAHIREAKIPFAIPPLEELPERLDAVLSVIYLVFSEGYSASSGASLTRAELSNEAIRLARLLASLLPDSEVSGLLALMLLQESRREARSDVEGDIVLLEQQDRRLWNTQQIEEGGRLVQQAMQQAARQPAPRQGLGFYTIQAAIAAQHAQAPSTEATDWNQVVALYSLLLQVEDSPVIELNRAVAVAMRDGAHAGLTLVDNLVERGQLKDYHLLHATRGELLKRSGQMHAAISAFEEALARVKQEPEKRLLQKKLVELNRSFS